MGLTNLKALWLKNNQISDLSVLVNLKNLVQLNIQKNPIQNMSAIRELRKQLPNLQVMESNR